MSSMIIEPLSQTKPETAAGTPLISVVVPVHNEAPNIPPLIQKIGMALAGIEHEIV
jgi:dolichol-phosphate mannosyltransferase